VGVTVGMCMCVYMSLNVDLCVGVNAYTMC